MPTKLTYRDAVEILGVENSPLVQKLDKLFGGLLLAATPFLPELLSIFDAKIEFVRLTDELVKRGIDKRRKMSQFDRIQRLHAARGVLMVAAYFDALEREKLPFDFGSLKVSRGDSVRLATAGDPANSLAEAAAAIVRTEIPLLGMTSDSLGLRSELERFYRALSLRVDTFLQGLAVWDSLDDTRKSQTSGVLQLAIPAAISNFDAATQRLAVESPEFAIWLNISGHRSSRDRLEDVHRAVQDLLTRAEPVERVTPALQAIVRFNRAVLQRKLIASEELPPGLDAPEIDRAYVNPNFRLADTDPGTPLNDEDFWARQRVCEDFEKFLLGYLSTPWAWTKPLVVLGHPGAGKSLLTEVQAARLPSPDFVSVRVALRDVPADVSIHEQIERAIRLSTHEATTWPDFARAARNSILVLFLDGFDELLQATGVSRSDYLLRVKHFQEIEETQGRHVAVIITSRVTVADRMRLPASVLTVRLEPFDLEQVGQWLKTWNEVNGEHLANGGRGPLGIDVVEPYLNLASQPLLLLMLAVYDAESGALQQSRHQLSQTELYERLLGQFARRQVAKTDRHVSFDDPPVRQELMVLSIVALGMFNRGAQWITDAQLAEDLSALRIVAPAGQVVTDEHRLLASEAKNALGRFYFVHRARTSLDDKEMGTYEFMHATFGEYLVVRLVWRSLMDMVERLRQENARHFTTGHLSGDVELRAFLSWSLLSTRSTTIDYLEELVARMSENWRTAMRAALLTAFHGLHRPEVNTLYSGYLPATRTATARLATYGANLLILLMAIGTEVTSKELYPESRDHVDEWTRTMYLWRSQLRPGEWDSLVRLYRAVRLLDGEIPTVLLVSREDRTETSLSPELPWLPMPAGAFTVDLRVPTDILPSAELICDPNLDLAVNALGGPEGLPSQVISAYVSLSGQVRSVAGDLVRAGSFHSSMTPARERIAVFERLVQFGKHALLRHEEWGQQFASQISYLLVNDDVVPVSFVLQHLEALLEHAGPTYRDHNLKLILRLFARISDVHTFLPMLDEMLRGHRLRTELAAEFWCALTEKGASAAEFPYEVREHIADLRSRNRDELLAHRPALLKRLSALSAPIPEGGS
ncbi:NACHT domain-containing protein [Amycolatopsis umgeniensis]|uniref:NACHT N-terminal Helical domain-containing protein n=1 Tax=Amycolatopsis umgeniensis TaxID=336628 RepID=A0A841BF05_9PSEU|nr:hypothetical protein [Amycolatopsis umgeniensis]MBB5857481.1 hypothetical protein [Amycolatopsis umgeniensis]